MEVFARSWKGLNLSPGERAFVKLVEGWVITALATGVAIAYQLLATGSHNFANIGLVAAGAAGLSVLNSFKKYLASQSDLPLSVASLATQAQAVATSEIQQYVPQAQAALTGTQVPTFSLSPTAHASVPATASASPQFASPMPVPAVPLAGQQTATLSTMPAGIMGNPNFGVMPPSSAEFAQKPGDSYPLAALGRELPQAPQPPKG